MTLTHDRDVRAIRQKRQTTCAGQGEPQGPCQPSWPRALRAGADVHFQALPPLTVVACRSGTRS